MTLLPCPFCGSGATKYHRDEPSGWSNTDWVCCDNDNCGCGTCLHETEGGAVSAWNSRSSIWFNISTAPRDGQELIVGRFDPEGPSDQPNNLYRIDRWHVRSKDGYDGWGCFNAKYWPATHWMPLPAPPA